MKDSMRGVKIMTRQKTVYPNAEIPHLWMHKTQDYATNSNRTFYFEGDVIYSYGSHWPIAKHITNGKGEKAILLNNETYGITTSCHASLVKYSIPSDALVFDLPKLFVREVKDKQTAKEAIKYYKQEIQSCIAKLKRANKIKPRYYDQLERWETRANQFSKFYRLGIKINLDKVRNELKPSVDKQIERNKVLDEIRAKKYEAERIEAQKRLAEQQVKVKEELENWANGLETPFHYSYYGLPTKLRIKGDNVETSLGANVPKEHAKKLYHLIKALVAKGESYQHNGHTIHIGHYQVDSISADGTLKAGCHVIAYDEICRIGEQL